MTVSAPLPGLNNTLLVADPEDAGMLDVVGFDAAAPSVIGEFVGA